MQSGSRAPSEKGLLKSYSSFMLHPNVERSNCPYNTQTLFTFVLSWTSRRDQDLKSKLWKVRQIRVNPSQHRAQRDWRALVSITVRHFFVKWPPFRTMVSNISTMKRIKQTCRQLNGACCPWSLLSLLFSYKLFFVFFFLKYRCESTTFLCIRNASVGSIMFTAAKRKLGYVFPCRVAPLMW